MPRRIIVFVILAAALAAIFVRLGIWQLSRLAERRASNAVISARLAIREVEFASLQPESISSTYRRVVLTGAPDTASEFLVTGRSRNGSPGVHIITPIRIAGGAAVLVNRGWVYAPDAATADLKRWRETRQTFHGYTLAAPYTVTRADTRKRTMRSFGFEAIHELVPYPVNDMYVVAQDSGNIDSTPARLSMPILDNGPHLSYAIQWFSFAVIAIAGAIVVARKSVTRQA